MRYQDEGGSRFMWFVVGIGVGAGIALLYAPKTGRETRKILNKKAGAAREFVEERGEEIYDRGREFVDRGREIVEEASDLVERGRKFARI